MKQCKFCGCLYSEEIFNDVLWHTREWGCRSKADKRIVQEREVRL